MGQENDRDKPPNPVQTNLFTQGRYLVQGQRDCSVSEQVRHSGVSDKVRFAGRLEGGTMVPRFPPQTPPSFLHSPPGADEGHSDRRALIAGRNRHEQAETSEMDRGEEAQDPVGDAVVRPKAGRDLPPRGSLTHAGLPVAQTAVGLGRGDLRTQADQQ